MTRREHILKAAEFPNWFQSEYEKAKACCESCKNDFLNAEVNMQRAFNANLPLITALADRIQELEGNLELYNNFIKWLEAGFGGMFGHQEVTPQQDAWDSIPEYMSGIKQQALSNASALDDLLKGDGC